MPDPGEQTSADKLGHKGGLIAAYRLAGDGGAQAVGWDVLDADPLGSKEAGDLWVHLDRTAPRARTWLESASQVSRAALPALLSPDPRPRLTHFGEGTDGVDGFLLILRGVNLNPDSNPENMVSIRLWVDEHRIISLRRRKVMAIQVLRDLLLKGTGPRTSADFVSLLAGALIERMEPVLDRFEAQMDDFEDRLGKADPEAMRDELSELRRVAVRLHRYLQPQREILRSLASTAPAWFNAYERLMVHDAAERAAQVVDELDELKNRATIAYDELVVRTGERMNRISTKLTLVATIFLPLGFLAGVWGMNFSSMPLADHPGGFWMMMLIMGVIAGLVSLLSWWMLRR
ncbi:MAG: zinc transporter ZntB [Phycisphaeraceae bacterium]|nr:MAG: zinc transporter ZntB [Phycisphaeraceae bacterium]